MHYANRQLKDVHFCNAISKAYMDHQQFFGVTFSITDLCVLKKNDLLAIKKSVIHYTLSQKKQDTKLLPITSPNVNRFSKFFHWQTHW